MDEIDSYAKDAKEAGGIKRIFWLWYSDHQNDVIPGTGVFGIMANLKWRRMRAGFEKPFGKKPDWV